MHTQRLTWTLLPFALAACYEYVPLTPTTAPPSDRVVRATLTDAGSVALAPTLGPLVSAVDGTITARPDSATVVFAVRQTTTKNGAEHDWNGESVTIPASAIASYQLRRLSRPRSFALGAMMATVVGLAVAVVGPGSGSAPTPRTPPGTQ